MKKKGISPWEKIDYFIQLDKLQRYSYLNNKKNEAGNILPHIREL